jgi:hypothetical protein
MDLFGEIKDSKKEEEYASFLRDRGYIIISPSVISGSSIKCPGDLVDYFYSLLQFHNSGRNIHYTKTFKRDIRSAKNFIKNRQKISGASNKRILQECAAIVKCVVEHEEVFSSISPLHSFDCFGQENMKWVTDKAIGIINKENVEVGEKELALLIGNLYIAQEKEALQNIDGNLKNLKRILGGLENDKEEG